MRAITLPALFATLFATLLALPALAQQVDTNTRAGLARIIDNSDGTKDVAIGSQRVDLPDDAYLAFFDARLGDLLLVLYSPGGNACNGFYTWVHATPGDIRRSDSFGTCAERSNISWDAETVRVTMPSREPGVGNVTFIYDGKGPVRRQVAGFAASGISQPEGWIGRYPFELVAAGEMQAPLRALIGAGALLEVQRVMDLAAPMVRDGNWVAGSACLKADCQNSRAAVAINLQDGCLLVALQSPKTGPALWGRANGPLPGAIREVVEGR